MKLLPDSIKLFIAKRLLELTGISSILLSFFVFISVASYSKFDPNIFNLSNYEVTNLGGRIGANTSEVLLQTFGYSSYLICIVLISWSYKLFFFKKFRSICFKYLNTTFNNIFNIIFVFLI